MLRIILPFLLFLAACGNRRVETVTVKGSDTEVNLVLELAEAYMEQNPNVSLSIAGGGSGVGIAALLNGRADMANSSRDLNDREKEIASERGLHLTPTVFATDALAVVTHPDVNIKSLTLDQVGAVFSGAVSNWSALGGPDGTVSLYGRQSNSGTFLYFRERVLKRDYSQNLKQLNGTAQIIEAIRQDPNGIGYVGFGYLFTPEGQLLPGLNVIALAEKEGEPAVSPLDAPAIQAGRYPLTRPLYQFTNGAPTGALLDFIRFELGPAGQAIIRKNGYLDPSVSTTEQPTEK